MTEANRQDNLLLELNKGAASMRAAQACAELGLWDDAVSRAYYAAFHFASALLFSAGVEARSHRGVHDLLFTHFVAPGLMPRTLSKRFAGLQRFREDADDSRGTQFDEAAAREELAHAVEIQDFVLAYLRGKGFRTS